MGPKTIQAPFDYYYGVFLNMNCSLKCDYCVQKISLPEAPVARYPLASGKAWVEALNLIENRTKKRFLGFKKAKKISITGGEPSLHPDFVYILNNLDSNWKITVTTNLTSPFFDQELKALKQIKRRRSLKFNASYHFMYGPIEKFIENAVKLKKAGHTLHSLFIVAHPGRISDVAANKEALLKIHPVVKLQRFFGRFEGVLYPNENFSDVLCEQVDGIKNFDIYRAGFNQTGKSDIFCRMRKVLFAPNGDIYNCHYKLYTGHKDKLGNLFDANVHIDIPQDFFLCHDYGFCNPCDSEGHAFRQLDGTEINIGHAAAS